VPLPRRHGEPPTDDELIAWVELLLGNLYGAETVRPEQVDSSAPSAG